jgi:hypothetical protein
MPTFLPVRSEPPPERPEPEPEFRNVMVASAMLLLVLGLVCGKYLPPTPGYSLARSSSDIQLSP